MGFEEDWSSRCTWKPLYSNRTRCYSCISVFDASIPFQIQASAKTLIPVTGLIATAEHLDVRLLILQCRTISAGIYIIYMCVCVCVCVCVAIVGHTQECNYHLRLTYVRWYDHVHVRFCRVHLGTRL